MYGVAVTVLGDIAVCLCACCHCTVYGVAVTVLGGIAVCLCACCHCTVYGVAVTVFGGIAVYSVAVTVLGGIAVCWLSLYTAQCGSACFPWQLHLVLRVFQFCCTWKGAGECDGLSSWWLPTTVLSGEAAALTLDGGVCGADQFIVGLRYAWRETPCVFQRCAVYSTSGLPGPPFVTVKPPGSGTQFTYDIDWSQPQVIP